MDQAGQLFQRLRRRGRSGAGTMFSTTHRARFGGVLQGIGQFQADVAQSFLPLALARQFQHRRAVVQRRDLAETPGEFRQESAKSPRRPPRRGAGAKASASSKAITLYGIAAVLRSGPAGPELVRRAGEESWLTAARWACTASIRARTSSGSARSSTSSSGPRASAAASAFGQGQRTSVEDRVALAARRHQPGLGQHLEWWLMPDSRWRICASSSAERIVGRARNNSVSQRVASRLAQRGESGRSRPGR